MIDILSEVRSWVNAGQALAMATVVETWGSSPRAVGARMAVREDGAMAGSVSGGCVEGAVVQEALDVLGGGAPRLLNYGVTDETAWEVGLACGGSIAIFVQRFEPAILGSIEQGYDGRRAQVVSTVVEGPESTLGMTAVFDASGLVAGQWSDSLMGETHSVIESALERMIPERAMIEVAGVPQGIFLEYDSTSRYIDHDRRSSYLHRPSQPGPLTRLPYDRD